MRRSLLNKKIARELLSFTAPYYMHSHWQTHSVSAALRFFPVAQRHWGLEDAGLSVVSFYSGKVHLTPACPYYASGLRDLTTVNTQQAASVLCPTCAALVGSSMYLPDLVACQDDTRAAGLLYAMFSSWLYAHSTTSSEAAGSALGYLSVSALQISRDNPSFCALLQKPLDMSVPTRARIFASELHKTKLLSNQRKTIVLPEMFRAPLVLLLSPKVSVADRYLVVHDSPDVEVSPVAYSFSEIGTQRAPLLHSFLASGMAPPEAYAAASVI